MIAARSPLAAQIQRYMVGGLLCAVLHNVIVIGTNAGGIGYPFALLLSALVTVPLGYVFHSAVTFGRARSWTRLSRYLAGAAAGFCGSAALMVLMCSGLRIPVPVATPVATVILFAWNFTAARLAILSRRG